MKAKLQPSLLQILSIGQVAKQAGVGIETIRFYEREGVIEEPGRSDSGYREYEAEIVTRLKFIKRAQALGFSLKEIAGLLALRVTPKENCSRIKKQAEQKLEEIGRKIADLKRMQKVLNDVTKACVASRPISDCPILKCFDEPA